MRLNRGRLEVGTLLTSVLKSHQPLFGHRLVHVVDMPVPEIFADRDRVIQILTNFLSNAIKMTEDDGKITFRLQQHNGMVAIGIEDSGPGLSVDDLSKLFKKFSQVGAQQEGRARGTGLGLVVCKELTELHGGRIDVASEPGRGSTFTVWLPVYKDEFVLQESFRELHGLLPSPEGETIGLITIKATENKRLEPLAAEVRQRVHRGDLVFAYESGWVVVLALVHANDVGAIVRRLQQVLPGADRLRFGMAAYPYDGKDATALLRCAQESIA